MNGRSGLVTFLFFLLLTAMIVLQILSMVQSDRLYERLNRLLDIQKGGVVTKSAEEKKETSSLPGEEYPGDEGDWLVWGINAEPATLNYIISKDIYANWVVGGNVFETLLEYDLDKVKLKPLLAESYEVSADGLQITFRLRDDVHFSDGKKITTDDIIFSYQTIINPKVDAISLANYYRPIKEVIRIDERTVKFVLREPYFKGVEIAGLMPVFPRHIYEFSDAMEFNNRRSEPVGSGPYVFERWNVGREIVLRRDENYWGKKPKISKIVFRVITNEVAELQALRSHDIDFMRPTSEQFSEVSKVQKFLEEFRCLSYWDPTTGYSYIGWNEERPFFKDRRVRQVLTMLINRDSINEYLLKGLGHVISGPFYIYGHQGDPNIQPWPYDPQKAKQLLDEAGWVDHDGDGICDKDGVPFKFRFMTVSGTPFYERLAKLIKDEMAKVGIELTVDPYEWSVFQERLNTRSFDAVTLAWGGTVEEDPYQIWHSSQIGNRGSNYVGFKNAEADSLIEQARRTMDEDKRNELYPRLHRILHEEQPYTFMFTRPFLQLLDRRFENVKVHKLGLNPLEWYVPRDKQRYK
jgi:peptide/nickel transport system substrate-binding protein